MNDSLVFHKENSQKVTYSQQEKAKPRYFLVNVHNINYLYMFIRLLAQIRGAIDVCAGAFTCCSDT